MTNYTNLFLLFSQRHLECHLKLLEYKMVNAYKITHSFIQQIRSALII